VIAPGKSPDLPAEAVLIHSTRRTAECCFIDRILRASPARVRARKTYVLSQQFQRQAIVGFRSQGGKGLRTDNPAAVGPSCRRRSSFGMVAPVALHGRRSWRVQHDHRSNSHRRPRNRFAEAVHTQAGGGLAEMNGSTRVLGGRAGNSVGPAPSFALVEERAAEPPTACAARMHVPRRMVSGASSHSARKGRGSARSRMPLVMLNRRGSTTPQRAWSAVLSQVAGRQAR